MDGTSSTEPKRARSEAVALPSLPPAPQRWPSQAELLGAGLEGKAEVQGGLAAAPNSVGTESVSHGAAWRQQGFESADADGAELRRRQAEVRRAMLPKS